jgi:PAS domain S-box-containing protein
LHVAALLDLSADAILTVSPDEIVTSWNRGAERMLGWTAAEMVGRPFTVLLPEEERSRGELEWIHDTTIEQGYIRDHETRRRRKDGTPIDVSLTRTAVTDERGRLVGFTAILRDISQRKRMERDLLSAERLATAGRVAAGVAHEIGAPLTALSMAVDRMLRGRCAECTGRDDLEVLRSQTERIARLARQLVNLAKPAGLVRAPLQLNHTVHQALQLVAPQLARKNVRTSFQPAADLPPVEGDDAQLQQVVINLLLNSQQALGPEGGEVLVATRSQGGSVEIAVADSGPGIKPGDLPLLFTPFFTTRAGGAGLGLALAAQITHAHGGSIEASSEPGRGATFTVRLPAPTS